MRAAKVRGKLLVDMTGRVRKQDATLRRFAQRTRLRAALRAWSHAATGRVSLSRGLRWLRREWLHRWQHAAELRRRTLRRLKPERLRRLVRASPDATEEQPPDCAASSAIAFT